MIHFTTEKFGKGVAKIAAIHRGVTYRFESVANKDAPQFGGFIAMGVFPDKKLDDDPDARRVVDKKLELNVNKDPKEKWLWARQAMLSRQSRSGF